MFHAGIIVTVCASFCSLHGLVHAVPRDHSLAKRSNDLLTRHGAYHRFERALSSDYTEDQLRVPQGGRGLISGIGNLVKGAVGMAGGVAKSALKTGHHLILPPLKGIEWITGKVTSALQLPETFLKSIAGTVKSSWKLAKTIEFPGKSVVALVFPNRIVSIADKLTHRVMHFATKTKEVVKATLAHTLYATLMVIFSAVSKAVKTFGFDCIPVNKTSLELNAGFINTVEISGGNICGLDSLQPENNITITKDDGSFMVITMPWVFRDLDAKLKSVDVTGFMGSVMKDQPVETTVKKIVCKGTISFQKGTFLRFVALHLEFEEITGINIKLEGAMEEGGAVSGIIDGLAGALSGVIQNLVNGKLLEMEKRISDHLLENSRRRR